MLLGASWAPAVAFGLLLLVLGVRPQDCSDDERYWICVGRALRRGGRARAHPVTNEYFFFAGYVVLQFVVLATAWNILGGYAGYVNFGTPAFFGIGAYTGGRCCSRASARRSRCRSPPPR